MCAFAGLPEEKATYAEVMGVHRSVPAQQASHHPGADDGEKLPAFFPFAFRFLLAFCLSLSHVLFSFPFACPFVFPTRMSFSLSLWVDFGSRGRLHATAFRPSARVVNPTPRQNEPQGEVPDP